MIGTSSRRPMMRTGWLGRALACYAALAPIALCVSLARTGGVGLSVPAARSPARRRAVAVPVTLALAAIVVSLLVHRVRLGKPEPLRQEVGCDIGRRYRDV